MTTPERATPAHTSLTKAGLVYLVVWFGTLFTTYLFRDDLMVWLVGALRTVPAPVVIALSWAPVGLATLFGTCDAVRIDAGPKRQPWTSLIAAAGLVLAVQVPTVLGGLRPHDVSEVHKLAAATPAGQALTAGLWWACGAPLACALLFALWRWVASRLRGEKVKFADSSWAAEPRTRRTFTVVLSVAVLAALITALVAELVRA